MWPVVLKPARGAPPDACEAIEANDLLVTEDGVPRPIHDASRRPDRALHALLLDASLSMRTHDRLDHAREAAKRYVKSLPPDEHVLVAEFDDSLRLALPPSLDREAAAEAISKIRPGNGTALWDALHDLLRYLESWPGMKTLVLLTDGEDSTSLLPAGRETVLGGAREAPDVSVFPLALDLSSTATSEGYRTLLRQLADTTGGLYFEVRGVSTLDVSFEALRAHLGRRWYVTYEPLGGGEGAQDGAGGAGLRRRVRVRTARGVPCRVDASLRRERAETEPARRASFAWAEDLAPPVVRGVEGGKLLVRTPDVVLERGVLWRRGPWERSGKLSATVDRKAEVELRELQLEVAPLEVVQRDIAGPEDVLLYLLRSRIEPSALPVVHGRTLLELRGPLARALYELRGDYRSFVRDRAVEDARPEIERVLGELGRRDPPIDAAVLDAVRATLLEHAAEPEGLAPARFLAEWLGDVPARDAAARLEARLAELAFSGSAEGLELARGLAGPGWERVHVLLPPATTVRVIAPLVPAWDEERAAIGFYRFILPRPALDGPPEEPVPQRPLGLEAALRLARESEAFRGLVVRIEHVARSSDVGRALVKALRVSKAELDRKQAIGDLAIVELAEPAVAEARLTFVAVGTSAKTLKLAAACVTGTPSPRLELARASLESSDGYQGLDCRLAAAVGE